MAEDHSAAAAPAPAPADVSGRQRRHVEALGFKKKKKTHPLDGLFEEIVARLHHLEQLGIIDPPGYTGRPVGDGSGAIGERGG